MYGKKIFNTILSLCKNNCRVVFVSFSTNTGTQKKGRKVIRNANETQFSPRPNQLEIVWLAIMLNASQI